MKQKIELSDIFAKTEMADIFAKTEEADKSEEDYERRRIRRLLFAGVCPECGGKLRYRPSFDPDDWLTSYVSKVSLRVCICKSCKARKMLLYIN